MGFGHFFLDLTATWKMSEVWPAIQISHSQGQLNSTSTNRVNFAVFPTWDSVPTFSSFVTCKGVTFSVPCQLEVVWEREENTFPSPLLLHLRQWRQYQIICSYHQGWPSFAPVYKVNSTMVPKWSIGPFFVRDVADERLESMIFFIFASFLSFFLNFMWSRMPI